MKNKKIVSLLLAACLSIGAMSVNVWAENGGENKEEVPAPVVQELEGEKPEETKPEETKPEETKPEETKPEETKPADPPVAVAYGTAVAMAYKLENTKQNNRITIDKEGWKWDDDDDEWDDEDLCGAVFEIYQENDGQWEKVDITTTNTKENEITFRGLGYHKYKIVETKAPEGYQVYNAKELIVDFSGKTQNDKGYHADGDFGPKYKDEKNINSEIEYVNDIKIESNDNDDDDDDDIDFYNLLVPTNPDPDPTPDPEIPSFESTVTVVKHIEGLSDKPLTNEDLAKIMEQLEGNPLTISFNNEEFKASDVTRTADGWKWERPFEGTVIERNVKETGGEVEGYDIASCSVVVQEETTTSTTVTVTNHYTKKEVTPTGTFTITKVDANTKEPLKGATFTLSQNGDTIGGPRTTGADGKVTFDNLDKDTYILKETKAPQGYVTPNEYYTVKVNENGEISVWKVTAPSGGDFTVTLPDDFIIQNPDGNVVVKDKNFVVENTKEAPGTTSYTFMKHGVVTTVDSNGRTIRTTESPLAGAEFTLYDAEENMLQTVRSAADGSVTFSNLIDDGYYIIKETKAPSGYTGWNGRIYLSVRNNEENKLEAVADLNNHTGVKWDGNKLTVLNYTTVKETEHPVDNRPNGPTYRYDDDDDYVLPTVTRKDNNKKPANKPERAPKVEEVVPSKRNPETGSSSSMPIAMAAAAVSLTGLVVLCKKKDK